MSEPWQLEKPSWLVGILSALNVHAGQWAEVLGFKIPPFSFTPGEWLEYCVDWLLVPINLLLRVMEELRDLVDQAWDAAAGALSKVDDWLSGAATWFWSRLLDWWDSTWSYVQSWVRALVDALQVVVDPVLSWFAGIDDWIKDRLLGVYEYISSVTRELVSLDFFKAAWELIKPAAEAWGQFGEAFLELLQYPVEWFSSAVLEPILGQFAGGFERDMEESSKGEGEA